MLSHAVESGHQIIDSVIVKTCSVFLSFTTVHC